MRSSKRQRNFVEGQGERTTAQGRPAMVYHHTSSLRTNLIWMSGVIQLEGHTEGLVFHPQLGEIKTNANLRRAFDDFPKLAWFTRRLEVPNVLKQAKVMGQLPNGNIFDLGKMVDVGKHAAEFANMLVLKRLALGFPTDAIPVLPWREHIGYDTNEGRELNRSARDAGDNPNDWWVSDTPVEVLCATEVWMASSILNPKLTRSDWYLADIKRMVTTCRENKGAFIPPSWMSTEDQRKVAARFGLNIQE